MDDEFDEWINDDEEEFIDDTTTQQDNSDDSDVIDSLLGELGIEDKNRITYLNDAGELEEHSWKDLPLNEKINIITSNNGGVNETDLDDDEINLINTIRSSKMTPTEYLQYVGNSAIQNASTQVPQYNSDQYSDDELFVYDLLSRYDDISDEDAIQELSKAKENPELYSKKIGAIRNEYRNVEQNQIIQQQQLAQQQAQAQYEQFSNLIANAINEFSEFSGYDLNMDNNDMYELYDFITGRDAVGVNHFSKTLNDPKLVTKMAWFVLHGEDMVREIDDYYKKEIASVRKSSYEKGLQDASRSVYKQKSTNSKTSHYDDDDF